ncbi:MAG: DUF128 domain-containing protein [Nitrososphaerota archaeon]|nr:DUF128 domain-containing protein [Candidatus Bathyarchaeota archaeon]MDW8023324.1 DUF128 domain-containing protein [Nitrososphaerota archaeon]
MHGKVDRKLIEILRILNEQSAPVGARVIAKKLRERGYILDERTVRYHLRILDERGFTKNLGYAGRMITEKGLEEVKNALVTDRVGFIITKIESLIFKMDFSLEKRKGKVIANVATLNREHLKKALQLMKKVISAGYCVSPYVKIADEGEHLGSHTVPEGKAMVATMCSITLDGILHHSGVPVAPRFGGVVQVANNKPMRFTELISYSGSTLDPLELFSAKGLNSVLNVVRTGNGYVLANLREIPMDALSAAVETLKKAKEAGICGLMVFGEPNMPVLGVPVGINKVGIAFIGGTNPLAGVSEAGIPIETKAIDCLVNFEEMTHIEEL